MSQAAAVAGPETVIRPPSRWAGLGLRELGGHRELLYFLVKRELQVRYKQSVFGVSWAVMQPLAYAFIFALFFGKLAKVPSEGIAYPVFALAGLVPWIFSAQAVGQGATSLVGDANLLSKVYFPRLVLPLAKVLSFLVDLVIALCVLGIFLAIYSASPEPLGLLLLPLFLLLAFVTASGAAILLSALNVQYRDITVAMPLVMQLWLFATPVVYPGSLITGAWQYVYALNPMVSVIQGTRWATLGTAAPNVGAVAVSVASAVTILLAGAIYFRRTERYFADVV